MADEQHDKGRTQSGRLETNFTEQELKQASEVDKLKGTIGELFSIRVYRNNLIIMMITWSFSSFAFFLVPLYIGKAGDLNIFLISFCLAVGEIISCAICLYLIKGSGSDNKKSLILFCAICCIGSIGALVFQSAYQSDN